MSFKTSATAFLILVFVSAILAGNASAQTYQDLFDFQGKPHGETPISGVVFYKGSLFGFTAAGGVGDAETLFKIDYRTGAETTLVNFSGKKRYGGQPAPQLLRIGNGLFGVTTIGGPGKHGAVFRCDTETGRIFVLHSFTGIPNGDTANGGLIYVNGAIYGTTHSSGLVPSGTVFKIDIASLSETVVHRFGVGADVADPNGGFVLLNGALYGSAASGGATGNGGLFKLDIASGIETVVHDAKDQYDLAHVNSLTTAGGLLFGTNIGGGTYNGGTVFAFDPNTGLKTDIHDFGGLSDGIQPNYGLIYRKGSLWGSTFYSRNTACQGLPNPASCTGVVYRIDLASGKETVVYQFESPRGGSAQIPNGGLLFLGGAIYGTTDGGGVPCRGLSGCGVVYKLTP